MIESGMSMRNLFDALVDAIKRHEAIPFEDWRNANREAKKIHSYLQAFDEKGDEGLKTLLPLVHHDDSAVAVTAARFLLERSYAPSHCIPILEQAAAQPGLPALGAQGTLRRYYEKVQQNESLPPPPNPEDSISVSFIETVDIAALPKLEEVLRKTPSRALYQDIPEFHRFEEHMGVVEMICANILDPFEDSINWIPEKVPPSAMEKLAWLWLIRPDLSLDIAAIAPAELRKEILDYIEDAEELT